jgi:hypothetical protein
MENNRYARINALSGLLYVTRILRGGLMTDLIRQIVEDLQNQIEGFESELIISDIGIVVELGDGIAHVHGCADVKAQKLYS